MNERTEAWILGGAGLIKGVYQEYIKDYPGVAAWAVMGAGIVTYELLCSRGNTLSETADIAINKHPLITRGVIGLVALHLANLLPEQYDPLHKITLLGK